MKSKKNKELALEDYSMLFLPVHSDLKPDPANTYSQIKNVPEFKQYVWTDGKLSKDKTIYYINFLYSVNSPLIRRYKNDLKTRKHECAILAGFTPSDKREWRMVEDDLFKLKDPSIAKMVFKFLIMQKNPTWMAICSNEQTYQEYLQMTMVSIDMDDDKKKLEAANTKSKLLSSMDEILSRLKGLYKEFFGDDTDLLAVYQSSDFDFETPEQVAKINREF